MTVDSRLVTLAATRLSGAGTVVAPAAAVADGLRAAGVPATTGALADLDEGSVDAIALLADELSTAHHDEVLIADASRALRGGGLLAVSAVSSVYAQAAPGEVLDGCRTYRAADVRRALGHHGVDTELLCAPGAAAALAGDPAGRANLDLDREPGLLDAAPRILAIGRLAATPTGRSATYFSTLPSKLVAAAVLCRDASGRILLVHDSFKQHWTVPGGVVDPDEDPRDGAVREAWEEAGVRVAAGRVLGLFSGAWPDRVVVMYDAQPLAGEPEPRGPVNAHEIDAVEWVDIDEALRRLAPYVAFQVRSCLEDPGGTHRLPL